MNAVIIITEITIKTKATLDPKRILRINIWLFLGIENNGAITPAANHATAEVVKKFDISFNWLEFNRFIEFIVNFIAYVWNKGFGREKIGIQR